MILDFAPADVTPDRDAVLRQIGIPPDRPLSDRIERILATAEAQLRAHAAPAGVLADLTADDFAAVYRGEGLNAPDGPVAAIFPQAEHLALFAVTLGPGIGEALRACFDGGDFALAYTLDAMASVAADELADEAERRFGARLRGSGWTTADGAVLRYSPGYCGWHVSGQRRLFARLQPAAVGLSLTESCLMQPLKSVSGVLLAGPRAIHRFPPRYDFCDACEDRTCRERLQALFAGRESDDR